MVTVVALTGGIASGKTTVTRVLEAEGVVVIDADQLARDAVAPGSLGLDAVVTRFGAGVLDQSGALRREALGKLVFGDSEALSALNAIIHPEVWRLSQEAFGRHFAHHPDVPLVYAVPLLAESDRAGEFDLVVLVDAPEEQRVQRLVSDRGMTGEEATARVKAQASDIERRAISDVVIDASVSTAHTEQAARELAHALWKAWPDKLETIPRLLPSSPG